MAKIKCKGKNNRKNKGDDWVAPPFGLRSGLRQSGSASGARFTAGLKPGSSVMAFATGDVALPFWRFRHGLFLAGTLKLSTMFTVVDTSWPCFSGTF